MADVRGEQGTYAEDAAHASGDDGVFILAVRTDGTTSLTSTSGDYSPIGVDAAGRVFTTPDGNVAHDAADAGNPVKVGARARNALLAAVANNDRSDLVTDLFGRLVMTMKDPAQQVSKSFNATTQQTGIDVWSPAAGKKIAVTSMVVGTYGTTSGRIILWFGDDADTTYSAGTDQLLFAFSAAPSTQSKPGLVFVPADPVFCTTADRELHITTDAAVSIDVAVHGYEW